MNSEDIARMARLAAAAEREACARLCDAEAMRCEAAAKDAEHDDASALLSTAWKISLCAHRIRARGDA